MLEIWGRPYSSNVIPVLWTTNELALDYQLQLAGGSFGKLNTHQYQQINPNKLIPAIRDGDFALWESLAIIRYLCHTYGHGTLCPANNQTRALADQWMEWCSSLAFPPVIQLFFATVRTEPTQRDPHKISQLSQQSGDLLAILNTHLSQHAYVAGQQFTMGDIPLGCVVYRYFNLDIERPALPYVEAWYQRLCQRPAYKQHVMRFFGTNPSEWQALEKACATEGII